MSTSSEKAELTFHPFPRLPTELRLKIWAFYQTSQPPRFINIHYSDLRPLNHPGPICLKTSSDIFSSHIFYYPQPIPPLLHINREARILGLKIYKSGLNITQRESSNASHAELLRQEVGGQPGEYKSCPCEVSIRARRRGTEGFLYWDPNRDIFVKRPFGRQGGPLLIRSIEQGQKDGTWTEKVAGIWTEMSDLLITDVRWLVLDFQAILMLKHLGERQGIKTIFNFDQVDCVFLIDFGSTQNFGTQPYYSVSIEVLEEYYGGAIKKFWIGKRDEGREAPDLKVVRSFEEVSEEIKARTRA